MAFLFILHRTKQIPAIYNYQNINHIWLLQLASWYLGPGALWNCKKSKIFQWIELCVAENKLILEYLVHLYLQDPSVIGEQTTGHEILSGAWLHDLSFNLRATLSLFTIDIECCACTMSLINKTCKTIQRLEMIADFAEDHKSEYWNNYREACPNMELREA